VTAEAERVWVIDGGSGTVTPVDESRIGQPVRIGEDPTDIVTAFGAIWITDGGGKLWRVDPLTGETSTIDVGSPLASVEVDRHDGTLWVLVSTH
jgi:streptogramin lyase